MKYNSPYEVRTRALEQVVELIGYKQYALASRKASEALSNDYERAIISVTETDEFLKGLRELKAQGEHNGRKEGSVKDTNLQSGRMRC